MKQMVSVLGDRMQTVRTVHSVTGISGYWLNRQWMPPERNVLEWWVVRTQGSL